MENNDKNNYNHSYTMILNISWIITLVICSVLLIINLIINRSFAYPLSYFLGAMTSMMSFTLLKNNLGGDHLGATKGINFKNFGNYLIRMAIYGGVLYISIQKTTFNPIIVATGFLTVKIAIYTYAILNKNE
ncbi:ATP synthase subunit I [Haloplasma contractile]|uniref:ATP synthase I chain protein n=1 Tax=Haloplasma contractile SSD-17B TaxID=1033810 RepID=U2FEV0_9MOLU|nr:ATP synthase subunit I [Haloplasma contractile]ERJ11465.1 ATP synthase I chain protein [Haloplasma contractile SSD-17B]